MVFLLAIIVAGYFLNYEKEILHVLLLVGFNHVLSTFFLYLRSNLSAVGKYRKDSLISAADKIFMLFIIGGLLVICRNNLRLEHFIVGQTISLFLAILVAGFLLKGYSVYKWPVFSFDYARIVLKKSFPFALILLFMAGYSRLDAVMLERMLADGDYQAGIYAASLRYMDASNMVIYLFAALLLPMFSRVDEKGDEIKELCDIAVRTIGVLGLLIAIIFIVYSKEWMSVYTQFDNQYNLLILFHMMSFFCIGIAYIYGTLLMARKKIGSLNLLFAAGLVFNFLFNYLIIPEKMATGAAITTFITQLLMALGQIILAHRFFKLKYNLSLIFKLCIFAILSLLFTWSLYEFAAIFWIWGVIISIIFMVTLAFGVKILNRNMLIEISLK